MFGCPFCLGSAVDAEIGAWTAEINDDIANAEVFEKATHAEHTIDADGFCVTCSRWSSPAAAESHEFNRRWFQHKVEYAAREREQEMAAYAAKMERDEALTGEDVGQLRASFGGEGDWA